MGFIFRELNNGLGRIQRAIVGDAGEPIVGSASIVCKV